MKHQVNDCLYRQCERISTGHLPWAPPGWTSPKTTLVSHAHRRPIWPVVWFCRHHHTGGLCTFSPRPCTLTKHRSCLAQPAEKEDMSLRDRQTNKQNCQHLHLHPVSASLQPCRSLGTHRLGASPPGLGDRRLKPLQGSLQVDCQWRKLYQGRGATFSLLLHHQWNHH